MDKILIPVDGSESSHRAVQHLVKLASGYGAPEVHLVNVQPAVMSGEISALMAADEVERLRKEAGEAALRTARTILDASAIRYRSSVLLGDPVEMIGRYARENVVDGIVMGTRGMGPLRNLILGSVATKLINLLDVPITLVK